MAILVAPATVVAASQPGSAVVLVSGFDTTTPFTTSAPACAGEEGATWSAPTGPAAAPTAWFQAEEVRFPSSSAVLSPPG